MRDDTPYRERPATERAHEQRCMRTLLEKAPAVDYIWEAFGGLGETGSVLRELQPQARVQACDLDAGCVEEYCLKHGAGSCVVGDAVTEFTGQVAPRLGHQPWAASLDFNRLTIMDLRGRREGRWKVDLLAAVLGRRPRWCQVTDSAIRYLHLNWQRYGLQQGSAADYSRAFSLVCRRSWGYRITGREAYHAASYYLLEPV